MNVKIPRPKGEIELLQGKGAYVGYRTIDLTDIRQIEFIGIGADTLQICIDSPQGRVIGQTQPGKDGSEAVQKINIEALNEAHDLYFVVKNRSYSLRDYIKFNR